MSKNKNKTSQQQATTKPADVKEKDKGTAKPQVDNSTKKEKVIPTPPPVEKPKVEETPPVDTTIEQPTVEEVQKEDPKRVNLPGKVDIAQIVIKGNQRYSADGMARLLDVAERRTSKMKPNDSATIRCEQMLDYNLAWALTTASIQTYQDKEAAGILVPNDKMIVQEFVDTMATLGVALEAHQTADGTQQELQFKSIDPETVAAVKEEKKQQEKPAPELDPLKWTCNDDAKTALSYILAQNTDLFGNKLNNCLMKARIYRQNQETDPVKKNIWDSISIGDLFEDLTVILDNKNTLLIRGLCAGTTSSLVIDKNVINAHCGIRRNLPAYSDEEAASLLKAFIKVRQDDRSIPLDDTIQVKNGILTPTRDEFLEIPALSVKPSRDLEDETEKYNIDRAKKIMNAFYTVYKTEYPMTNPDFNRLATNKMIEIRNLYVDKDSAFALYTQDEYPKPAAAAPVVDTADSKTEKATTETK